MSLIRTRTRVIAAATVCFGATALLAGGPAAQAVPGRDPTGPAPALQTTELAPAAGASPTGPAPALQTIELAPAAGASRAGSPFAGPGVARGEAAGMGMAVSRRHTRPFSLLGVTWANPRAALDGTVEVRTRTHAAGRWTAWQRLDADEPDATDPGTERGPTRGSTDPLWVGESDGVEARVASAGGRTRPLPAELRLDLINPDQKSATPSVEAARAAYPARPVPRLITRAGWRADESLVKQAPEYTSDVQVLFVHHTATSNGYTCGQSAGIVRGIELYHVRSKGWNDIGYNFLVDKCGNLFEGRGGGVDRPVLGAHTLGFNAHSAAIAVIGNYTGTGVPAVVRNVIAQVAAYKIGTYGNNPAGRTVLVSNGSDRYPRGTAVTLNRISGHRDTGRTECPGDALYSQLGTIRGVAGAGPRNLAFLRMTGAVKVGSRYFTRGPIRPLWNTGTPSALLDRFDVFVDDVRQTSVPGDNRRVLLRLTPGAHTVTVRAVHLNGRSASVVARIVADPVAPVFTTTPELVLRTGSLAAAVPVRLRYAVADGGGLSSVALTSPDVVNLGTAPRTWPGDVAFGVPSTWTVRANDWAGNTTRAAVTRTAVLASEAQSARTGSWRTVTSPAYLGGAAALSTTAGSTMAWTFTGVAAQLAVTRTTGSGRIRVYLDDQDYGLLDLRATSTVHRYAIWAPRWRSSGRHTLRLVVEGTAGRPAVIVDGLVNLR